MIPEDQPHVCMACGEAAHTDAEHEIDCLKEQVADLTEKLRGMTFLEAKQAARVTELLSEVYNSEQKALIARQGTDELSEMPQYPRSKSIKQSVIDLAREMAQLREQVAELRGERQDVAVAHQERQLVEAQLHNKGLDVQQLRAKVEELERQLAEQSTRLMTYKASAEQFFSQRNAAYEEVRDLRGQLEEARANVSSELSEEDGNRVIDEVIGEVRQFVSSWPVNPNPNPTETGGAEDYDEDSSTEEEEVPSVESMCGFPVERREELLNSFRLLQKKCHQLSVAKGWYNPPKTVLEALALIVEEAAEAMRHYRRSKNDKDLLRVWLEGKDRKPEGFPIELSDLIIRALDLAEYLGIDVAAYVLMKHHYNLDRPYRHGDCRA